MPRTTDAPARVPVLVIGGGPAGLTLALELGLHGVPVTVVEPRRTVEHGRPRAKTTSARTMELFRRWGVADAVRAAAAIPVGWSDRVTFCTTVTGPEVTAFTGVFGLDLVGSDLVAEAGQQVTQPVIEEVLREAGTRSPSIELLLGRRAVEVVPDTDSVLVVLEDEDGERRAIEADHVVGADGPRSLVRRAIGARYVGAEAGRPNVNITFRAPGLADLVPHPPSIHYWVLDPAAPGVVGPLDLDGTWWGIATGVPAVADDVAARAIVHRLIGRDDVDVEVIATDPWQAKMLLADRYGDGRIHLIGDAAHQNPPWGGHGFNTGVGDAMNLGWKLAAVVNGWAPPALLTSYEAERRPVAQATIDVAAANTATLSLDLADPALMGGGAEFEAARSRAAAIVQGTKDAEFHSLGLVLGSGYTPAAAEQAPDVGTYRPRLVPGARLPHAWLADGRSLYDLLGLGLTAFGRPEDTAGIAAAAAGVPMRVLDPVALGLPPAPAPLVVVRPDQHIGWLGPPVDGVAAQGVLAGVLRGFPWHGEGERTETG